MFTDGIKQRRVSAAPPRTLNVQKFADSRASELETLHSIVGNRLSNDFTSRRNKRRRTTGYDNRTAKNRKRRKVGAADDGTKNGSSEKDLKKAPPRHIRRRIELKKNPASGFCCSGDGTKRLRTHVWHAKRFKMTKHWGFHLPLGLQGRGKGSRALLKWLKNGVVVHDASYYGAVQLEGPEDLLSSVLNEVMVPPPAKIDKFSGEVLSGVVHASSMLHHAGAPFSRAIAPVTYMWRPPPHQFVGAEAESHGTCRCQFRQLWVWIHAAAFKEGYHALQAACQRHSKIDQPTAPINCISLEGQLAKLEVLGSKASQLLQKILQPVSQNSFLIQKCSFAEADSENQPKTASILDNEGQISSSAIVSLTVHDPRASNEKGVGAVPQSKGSEVNGQENLLGVAEQNSDLASSVCLKLEACRNLHDHMDLWNVSKGLFLPLEESILCTEKHQQRLAFFCLSDKSSTDVHVSTQGQYSRFCPILLLRDSDLKDSISRWSIILPLSWAKAFWVPLVSAGARAIGLREKHWVACEVGLPYFPSDFPDVGAYSCFMATEAAASHQSASLRPLSVRPSSIPIPPPWECVSLTLEKNSITVGDSRACPNKLCPEANVIDNSESGDCDSGALVSHDVSFQGVVARTSSTLTYLLNDIDGDHLLLFPKMPDKKTYISKVMKDEKMLRRGSDKAISPTNRGKKLCFLRVLLHTYKGVFEEGAVICAPHLTDIKLWTSRSDNENKDLQVPQSSIASYFVQQTSGKWEMQVPEDPVAVDCHRWPIGFVTTGFIRGSKKPVAVALCEAILLARLREEQWNSVTSKRRRKEIYVLVRNLRSTAYRLALANIILEQQEEDLEYM